MKPTKLNLVWSAIANSTAAKQVLAHPEAPAPVVAITKAMIAAKFHILRNEYDIQPHGRYDKIGCWYPDYVEHCTCCDAVRFPTPTFWYALRDHCRSYKHIAQLFEVDAKDVIQAGRFISQLSQQQQQYLLDQALSVDHQLRKGSHIGMKKTTRRGFSSKVTAGVGR